jgi:hypothetical protein
VPKNFGATLLSMKFLPLFLREWKWWWHSPALWWSLPLALLMVVLYPPILIKITDLRINELEEFWKFISQSWLMFAKQMLKDVVSLLPQENVAKAEAFLKMPLSEIWQAYLLPPIKIFVTLPLITILPPLGMRLLQRDLDNGFVIQHLSHRGSMINFFIAKWLLNTLILGVFQLLAMILFLSWMSILTQHPEFFSLSDFNWYLVFFGLGLGIASCSLWLCWLSFLISRNGVTEHYTSLLSSFILWLVLLAAIKNFGLDSNGLLISSALIWGSNLILVLLISWMIRRERFWIH